MSEEFNLIQAHEQPDNEEAQSWYNTSGYQQDDDFIHHDYGLYHKDGKATLIYRSTDPTNVHDLEADLNIALGRERKSNRFKIAEDAYERASQKYGRDNVSVAGFSLGGSQAMYISDKYKTKATVFNPGVSPADVDNNYYHPRDYSKVDAYITVGDVISNSGLTMPNLKAKPIYATDVYKDVAEQFGPGLVETTTKAPVTKLGWTGTVLKRGAEILAPELIPFIEGGEKVIKSIGAVSSIGKDAYHAHSLNSMKKYFDAHPAAVTPKPIIQEPPTSIPPSVQIKPENKRSIPKKPTVKRDFTNETRLDVEPKTTPRAYRPLQSSHVQQDVLQYGPRRKPKRSKG